MKMLMCLMLMVMSCGDEYEPVTYVDMGIPDMPGEMQTDCKVDSDCRPSTQPPMCVDSTTSVTYNKFGRCLTKQGYKECSYYDVVKVCTMACDLMTGECI